MAGKRRSRKLTVVLSVLVAFVVVAGGITAWAWLRPPVTALSADLSVATAEYGAPVEVTFDLTSDGQPIARKISVTAGKQTESTTTDKSGSGSVTFADLEPGKHEVVVAYAGTDKSPPAEATENVEITPATTTLELASTPADGGKHQFAVTAKTSTGVPVTGTTTFTLDGKPLGEQEVADGSATITTATGLGLGDHTVVASFTPADQTRLSAAEAEASVSVTKSSASVQATISAPKVRYGDKANVAVTVATDGAKAGVVTLLDGTKKIAEGKTDAAGKALLTFLNETDPGARKLIVTFAGSAQVSAAKSELALTSTQTNVDIYIDRPTDLEPGGAATVTASIIGTPKKPTGKASISYDGKVIADGKIDAEGKISAKIAAVPEGDHNLEVTYAGDVRFEANKATSTLTAKKPTPNPYADSAAAINADNPCPAAASACVNLSGPTAWLQSGGKVTYGPVPMTSGRAGHRTNTGMFSVFWLHKDHKSSIFNDAPMPNSVFFDGGIAFHQGSLYDQSHGCIHLSWDASEMFFDTLAVGDQVYVYGTPPY